MGQRYYYRLTEADGYAHENWLFADSLADFWLRIASVVARMTVRITRIEFVRVTD